MENLVHRSRGLSLAYQGQSFTGLIEVASKAENPGVITTSRRLRTGGTNSDGGGNGSGVGIAGEAWRGTLMMD
ncbi:unnamed protein product, partial [Tuber aestivum]